MPPIKGRMMGLQSRMGAAQMSQSNIDFRNVKNLGIPRVKSKFTGRGGKTGPMRTVKDDQLKRLRIPTKLCRSLPSVKKFSNSRGFIDITDDDSGIVEEVIDSSSAILGMKRGRGAINKYHIQIKVEKRFAGMVWDLAFSPDSTEFKLLVSCGDSVFICDRELNKTKTLDKIRLAGGIGFLSDGRIVAMCRFMDKINIYTPEGEFLHDFPCGAGPMTVAVNSKDEIMVSDCISKQIHFYDPEGTLLRDVEPKGINYKLEWPLYMAVLKNTDFIVVDCHQQVMLVFDQRGGYVRTIPMRTYGGNEVLRPHGFCLTAEQDLCIIDSAIDTVEVFSAKGVYYQTLIPSIVGAKIRPKIMACGRDGHMVVGGLKGHVHLFKFVDDTNAALELSHGTTKQGDADEKVKVKPKKEKVKTEFEMKVEVKEEVTMDDVTVIVLD